MFTTPAIASEPYVAEEPPVRISTLSINAAGIVFRSTTPFTLEGVTRAPSTRTSVRDVPRPRRSTFAWPPFDGLLDVVVIDGTNCGSVLSTVSICGSPDSLNVSSLTVTTGLVAS